MAIKRCDIINPGPESGGWTFCYVKCTILIADDTEANIDILVDILGVEYDVAVAMDGESAF